MAKVFNGERIVPVWLSAVRALSQTRERTDRNFLLEIDSPTLLTSSDHEVIAAIDDRLRASSNGLSIETVSATLFPERLYRHYGRPEFYDRYLAVIKKGKDTGAWGTYAMRMIQRTHPGSRDAFNPLEIIVQKLNATRTGRRVHAAYELGVASPIDLLDPPAAGFGYELPIYDPVTDGGRPTNIPCLSHLSFKLNDDGTIDLTAVYRSHHYAQRALGNLIGLGRLLAFVSKEAELGLGTLTCVSTQAHLDVGTWGGVRATLDLLAALPRDETA